MAENKAEELKNQYKAKGFQQLSLSEYESIRREKAKKKSFKVPAAVKFILSTPLYIIFCCGLIFLPFMVYIFFTSPNAKDNDLDKKETVVNDHKK